MVVRREDIVDKVARLINAVRRSPYLSVGSGLPLTFTNFYPDELLP